MEIYLVQFENGSWRLGFSENASDRVRRMPKKAEVKIFNLHDLEHFRIQCEDKLGEYKVKNQRCYAGNDPGVYKAIKSYLYIFSY